MSYFYLNLDAYIKYVEFCLRKLSQLRGALKVPPATSGETCVLQQWRPRRIHPETYEFKDILIMFLFLEIKTAGTDRITGIKNGVKCFNETERAAACLKDSK